MVSYPRTLSFPRESDGKESAYNTKGQGLISGSGRLPVERNGYTLQYSCLQHSMNRGACSDTVHVVSKGQT